MTLKQLLLDVQLYTSISLYVPWGHVITDDCFTILHSNVPGILSRFDTKVDYITVRDNSLIVVLVD